jgi:hypothetical protein
MHSVFCDVKTEFYCTCKSFLLRKIKPLNSVMKSKDHPLFRVVKNEFVWKEQQEKDGACERRETSVCVLAESPFRILHFTIPAYCLTLWPWSREFKFQHTIYVKSEYFMNLKKGNIVKYTTLCRGINGHCASKSKKNHSIYCWLNI